MRLSKICFAASLALVVSGFSAHAQVMNVELQPLDPMAFRSPPNCGPYVRQGVGVNDIQFVLFNLKETLEHATKHYLIAKLDTVEVVKDDSKRAPSVEVFPGRVVLRISAKDFDEAPCLKGVRGAN